MQRLLLRLYPRAWRERYETEVLDMLEHQRMSMRTIVDLLAGAVDARLYPQPIAGVAGHPKGENMTTSMFRCASSGLTARDQWRSAGLMVGGSLVLTLTALVLRQTIGQNSLSEGLVYAAFPASLMLSSECTYFRRYSPAARWTLSVGGALFIILMMWASVAIGYRI